MELNLEAFLKVANEFQLGSLLTESPHPLTENLSQLAKFDTRKALSNLKTVDLLALKKLTEKTELLRPLHFAIQQTLDHDGRVFFCGCGATGRLSLSIETLWRQVFNNDRVIGFMAGGDVALIHSIEKFEDYPEFGARHLKQLGFRDGDLLVSTTEGGETPYVIGATEEAAKISSRNPFILYCNPDEILCRVATRSKNFIENPRINKINLTVGPMALTGSTRMQATTVLMGAVGSCLLNFKKDFSAVFEELHALQNIATLLNYERLEPLTIEESQTYRDGKFVLYTCDPSLSITVITDTTERAPTFSLFPFESQSQSKENPAWAYLQVNGTKDNTEAWQKMLGRPPRHLEWPEVSEQTTEKYLWSFELSTKIRTLRDSYIKPPQRIFEIHLDDKGLSFWYAGHVIMFAEVAKQSLLVQHLIIKMLMNAHSTLVMGRLGRFEGNLMTYVRPSNYKLIDRAIRYASILLEKRNIKRPYIEMAKRVFELREVLPRDQALVMELIKD